MCCLGFINTRLTLASLRFSLSWLPLVLLLVSILWSCGLPCCSASGWFRFSSPVAAPDGFTSAMIKEKIYIRGRSRKRCVVASVLYRNNFFLFISEIYFEFKKFSYKGNAALANQDLRVTVFKRKGELYQLLMVSLLCPEFLPAEHWRGRWGTHAACRENVRGSQSSPRRPETAPLQGTFGSLSRSLDGEEREGNYKKKGADITEKDHCSRSDGWTEVKSSQDSCHTAHPFHDGAQHQAGARLEHQDFTTSVDVCQRQDLGERVVP